MIILQIILFILIAPLLSGLITVIKNYLRMRKGQSILQPYYNLVKFFYKDEVISETASWIFRVTPVIVFSSALVASMLVPVFIFNRPILPVGDFIALVFIFTLGRFFLALAALDTGSSFGGMGSSREMFIASFVEPALCMVIFAISLQFGSTDITAFSGLHPITVSSVVAALALFLLVIAETSRIPIDNQETHLELTMVHEAMVLEYSGRSLALIELAAYLKQMIFFFLIAQLIFPIGLPLGNFVQVFLWSLWFIARIAVIAIAVAVVEVNLAKLRLFRVADFLGFAFVLGIIAVVCSILGA